MGLRGFGWSLALVALFVGCNKSEGPGVPDPKALGGAPDAAVKNMIASATSGDATVAWTILPPKQQADVKAVVQEAAGKIDPDVWNKTFATIGKLSQLLKTKKDYFLGSSLTQGMKPEEREELARNWQKIVDIVDALANSEIKTHEGLKATDPGKFLETTGTKVLTGVVTFIDQSGPETAADWKMMKGAKVSLLKQDGATASVKIEAEGSAPKEMPLKLIDGKWVPTELLDSWDGGIAGVKGSLAQGSMTPDQKQQALAALSMADMVLDKLLAAKDQKAFDEELAPIAAMIPMMLPQLGGPPPGAGGPVGLGGPKPTGPGTLPTPGSLPMPMPTGTTPTLPSTGPTLPGTTLPGTTTSGSTPTLPTAPGAGPNLPSVPK
ncbi:MAG: hypothetical protein C0483_02435 [Pirellula sp.]|nr:hypothetical protein [Pirellula sp.]